MRYEMSVYAVALLMSMAFVAALEFSRPPQRIGVPICGVDYKWCGAMQRCIPRDETCRRY